MRNGPWKGLANEIAGNQINRRGHHRRRSPPYRWLPPHLRRTRQDRKSSTKRPAGAPPKALTTDDRPYDAQLFRLAEILGTLHYLRELCGANEGQVWREHMRELAASEGTSALRRAKLVESFNRGYRDYSRTYRSCTQPAIVAIQRYMEQASAITDGLIANDK